MCYIGGHHDHHHGARPDDVVEEGRQLEDDSPAGGQDGGPAPETPKQKATGQKRAKLFKRLRTVSGFREALPGGSSPSASVSGATVVEDKDLLNLIRDAIKEGRKAYNTQNSRAELFSWIQWLLILVAFAVGLVITIVTATRSPPVVATVFGAILTAITGLQALLKGYRQPETAITIRNQLWDWLTSAKELERRMRLGRVDEKDAIETYAQYRGWLAKIQLDGLVATGRVWRGSEHDESPTNSPSSGSGNGNGHPTEAPASGPPGTTPLMALLPPPARWLGPAPDSRHGEPTNGGTPALSSPRNEIARQQRPEQPNEVPNGDRSLSQSQSSDQSFARRYDPIVWERDFAAPPLRAQALRGRRSTLGTFTFFPTAAQGHDPLRRPANDQSDTQTSRAEDPQSNDREPLEAGPSGPPHAPGDGDGVDEKDEFSRGREGHKAI